MSADDIELFEEELNSSEQEEQQERVAIAEEEYDPEKPEELVPTAERDADSEDELDGEAESLGSQDSVDEDDEEDEEDDSIVSDKIEYACKDHKFCIGFSSEVDTMLLKVLKPRTEGAKERQAAIAEVLCDHYCKE